MTSPRTWVLALGVLTTAARTEELSAEYYRRQAQEQRDLAAKADATAASLGSNSAAVAGKTDMSMAGTYREEARIRRQAAEQYDAKAREAAAAETARKSSGGEGRESGGEFPSALQELTRELMSQGRSDLKEAARELDRILNDYRRFEKKASTLSKSRLARLDDLDLSTMSEDDVDDDVFGVPGSEYLSKEEARQVALDQVGRGMRRALGNGLHYGEDAELAKRLQESRDRSGMKPWVYWDAASHRFVGRDGSPAPTVTYRVPDGNSFTGIPREIMDPDGGKVFWDNERQEYRTRDGSPVPIITVTKPDGSVEYSGIPLEAVERWSPPATDRSGVYRELIRDASGRSLSEEEKRLLEDLRRLQEAIEKERR